MLTRIRPGASVRATRTRAPCVVCVPEALAPEPHSLYVRRTRTVPASYHVYRGTPGEVALLANLLTRDGLTLPYTTTGNVVSLNPRLADPEHRSATYTCEPYPGQLTSINPCKPVPELYSVGSVR